MKTKTNPLDLMTAAQWDALTQEQRLDACQRAQLQASNAELLLRDALNRIALALATLNPSVRR